MSKSFNILTQAHGFVLDQSEQKLRLAPHRLTAQQKEALLWWEGYCDGSFQPSKGMLGIGGVLLNPYGTVTEIFSDARVMPGDSTTGSSMAEFEAVLRLLSLAKEKGIQKLLVKMDNRGATQVLNAGVIGRTSLMSGYVKKAKALEVSFEQVVYQWIPRVKNRYADSLSRAQIPETPSEAARKVAKKPPPSPKVSKFSMLDLNFSKELEARHPGVKVIDKEYFLANSRGEKTKAIAKWHDIPAFRFHTEHSVSGQGAVSGVESRSQIGSGSWMLCEKRSSPMLAELRLMIKMLKKAEKAGLKKIVIESSNQALCLLIAGLKEPTSHVKSAVFTFFDKAQSFESIGVHHKATVPAWSSLLEGALDEYAFGFHSFSNGFNVQASAKIYLMYDPKSQLVVTKNVLQEKELYTAKLAKTSEDINSLMSRSLTKQMEYARERGIKVIEVLTSDELTANVLKKSTGTKIPEHLKSDWGQMLRSVHQFDLSAKVLGTSELHSLLEQARKQIPKPFEQAPEKLAQWKRSQDSNNEDREDLLRQRLKKKMNRAS